MTQVTKRFDPFGDVDFPTGIRLFQDAVNRLFSEPPTARPWAPPVDILETENDLILKADLPDVEMKDIQIELEQGTLTVKGERKFDQKEEGTVGYHRIERSYGAFMRCFSIPDTVDAEKVKADYKSGVLTVTLPKKAAAKPRAIKIEVSE
ncbi:MAG: Hsp20/alpha crystallin family protein [Bryobacteraceae bacterium]|jgi:HSP20 family protein